DGCGDFVAVGGTAVSYRVGAGLGDSEQHVGDAGFAHVERPHRIAKHSPDHRDADRIPWQCQRELNVHRTPPGAGMSPGVGFPVKSGLTAKSRGCYLLLGFAWHSGAPECGTTPCDMCCSTLRRGP